MMKYEDVSERKPIMEFKSGILITSLSSPSDCRHILVVYGASRPPQAVPGTASPDGVDPGRGRPHRAPAQLLGGQR